MSQHLPYQLEVAGLLQDGRGGVVAEGMGTDFARQTSPHTESVKDVARVGSGERPAMNVGEDKILRLGVMPDLEPLAQQLRGLRTEEPDPVLAPLALANCYGPFTEPNVLDAQLQRLVSTRPGSLQRRPRLKTFLWRHIDRILIAAGFVLLMVILGATIRNLTRMYAVEVPEEVRLPGGSLTALYTLNAGMNKPALLNRYGDALVEFSGWNSYVTVDGVTADLWSHAFGIELDRSGNRAYLTWSSIPLQQSNSQSRQVPVSDHADREPQGGSGIRGLLHHPQRVP